LDKSKINTVNRWSYSTKSDKIKFVKAIHIISVAVVIQLFIYETLPVFIYGVIYDYLSLYYEVFEPGFFYSLPFEEINHIMINIVLITTAAIASLTTGVFIIICMKQFITNREPDPAVRHKNKKDKDKISFKFILPKNTVILLAVGVCIVQFSILLYMVLNSLIYSVFGVAAHDHSYSDMYVPQSALGIILYFIAIVITPSIFEEFIFRYVMLNSLKRYGNTFAIIVTSVLFGFAHGRMSAFVYATAIGVFSAYIAIKTKSIWFSIILHAVVNGMSFTLQFMSGDENILNIIYYSFLCFISLVSLVYLLALIIKSREIRLAQPENYVHISNRRKVLFFFNAATLVFFILAIAGSMGGY